MTPEEADEALDDPERVLIDPDYNSTSGRSALIIGFGLSVSTIARQLLLQSLVQADDLKTALDRLERDIAAVRRKALSA